MGGGALFYIVKLLDGTIWGFNLFGITFIVFLGSCIGASNGFILFRLEM